MWFSNPGPDTVRKQLRDVELPSHKWLPLIYQLAAKLGVAAVGEELIRIVERCILDHPHHTLFVLIALKNGRRGGGSASGAGGGGGAGDTQSSSTLIDAVVGLLEEVLDQFYHLRPCLGCARVAAFFGRGSFLSFAW